MLGVISWLFLELVKILLRFGVGFLILGVIGYLVFYHSAASWLPDI